MKTRQKLHNKWSVKRRDIWNFYLSVNKNKHYCERQTNKSKNKSRTYRSACMCRISQYAPDLLNSVSCCPKFKGWAAWSLRQWAASYISNVMSLSVMLADVTGPWWINVTELHASTVPLKIRQEATKNCCQNQMPSLTLYYWQQRWPNRWKLKSNIMTAKIDTTGFHLGRGRSKRRGLDRNHRAWWVYTIVTHFSCQASPLFLYILLSERTGSE